ncbi:hypothetical protein FRC02_006335 [Tulasnella sp. 418]|nr:hypothetical protein FRC02_006335 [Tulasnella sp. 418]
MPKVLSSQHGHYFRSSPYYVQPRSSASAEGVVVDMNMLGDGLYHCVYAVPIRVGPGNQEFVMQVDTGSSDIWIASTNCRSRPSCESFNGPKYDSTTARFTNATFDVSYHRGRVKGSVVIDSVELAGYSFEAQALVSATDIENEVLDTGSGFSGLIGLALQSNSVIAQQLRSNVEGATLTSHLFGPATSNFTPPARRFISLMLERPYHPAVASKLGLGAHPNLPYSLDPATLLYSDIIMSNPGPLFWRIPLTRITIDIGGNESSLTLKETSAQGITSIWPVAVFDSGGTDMITTRQIANAFYGAWGIGPGQYGVYYVPCDLTMNVTLTLGSGDGINVPIHPLDLSNPIPTEPGSGTCVGSIQATDNVIPQGDIILGASFLRNIYTVLSYESNTPRLGIIPFTNPEVARNEFETVRIKHSHIGTGLSPSQSSNQDQNTQAPATSPKGGPLSSTGLKVLLGIIGALAVIGVGLWIGLYLLRKRWKTEGWDKAAAKEENNLEMFSDHGPKKDKTLKSQLEVHGVAPEEAFSAFGGNSH